ncbi:MAG: hypothetical protein ACRDZ2_09630, partial [Ilumatobacteraceae bacterium]
MVLPIAFLAQIVVLAAILVGRIRPLRWMVVGLQRMLSEIVGDTYALLQSEVSFRKMVDQVRADLRWLSDRCDAVVVVAHSQGTAVAHEVVRAGPSPGWAPPSFRFVTFGAAVGRFVGMRALAESTRRAFTAASAYLVLTGALNAALLVAVATIWLSPEVRLHPSAWYDEMTFYVLCALFALLLPAGTAAWLPISLKRLLTRHRSQLGIAGWAAREVWRDLYASADPVPNGPLREPDVSPDRLRSDDGGAATPTQVGNRRNPFRDHTIYWNNSDEFVTYLMATVAPLTGPLRSSIEPATPAMHAAAHARSKRLTSLNQVRLAALLWVTVVCVTQWSAEASSAMRWTLSAWSIAVGMTLAGVFYLWSAWNRREEHRFVASHQSSQGPVTGPALAASALVVPAVVTYSFGSLPVRVELLAVLTGSLVVLLLLAAGGYLVNPARPYGWWTAKNGELRLGWVWGSCVGLIFGAVAWIAWVGMVAGSNDLGGVLGRLLVIDAAWVAFLSSSLG